MRKQGDKGLFQAPGLTCTQTGKKTEDLTADVHLRKKDTKPDSPQKYTVKGQETMVIVTMREIVICM